MDGYSIVIEIMKRWILDAIVGIISLIMFTIFLLILPSFFSGGMSYIVALLLFIGIISAGGYLIRDISP